MVRKFTRSSLKKNKGKIDWTHAPEVKKRVDHLVTRFEMVSFNKERIFVFSSINANTRAIARIWGLSKIWQQALGFEPAYIIEVISEKFDRLTARQKDEVLLHELAHIPKNFSGALAPHKRGKGHFHDKLKKLLSAYRGSFW